MNNIIVSLTSWKDRIDFAKYRVEEMLNQTLSPLSIELNLSKEEFPNSFLDLPSYLLHLYYKYKNFNINWCEGNTKVFKKLLPTLKKYMNQDVYIVTIDDDISYDFRYLQVLWENYMLHNTDKFCLETIPDCGSREIYRCKAFSEDIFNYLTPEIINFQIDDVFYRLYLEKKGKTASHLTREERDSLPKDLITMIDTGTSKLSDFYLKDNNISKAIEKIKESLNK